MQKPILTYPAKIGLNFGPSPHWHPYFVYVSNNADKTDSSLPYIQKLHVLVHIYVCASEAPGCVLEQDTLSSA